MTAHKKRSAKRARPSISVSAPFHAELRRRDVTDKDVDSAINRALDATNTSAKKAVADARDADKRDLRALCVRGSVEVIADVLARAQDPLDANDIVAIAGSCLPTRSRTPVTAIRRDIALEIKHNGNRSLFVRVYPGHYVLRSRLDEFTS